MEGYKFEKVEGKRERRIRVWVEQTTRVNCRLGCTLILRRKSKNFPLKHMSLENKIHVFIIYLQYI